ncbi:MAG TPA: DnaA N-terminal domain-containing protein, partial [Candidatus Obscuribacter sp.]|nr:DnaA N-terminal domain-containing protein [Candidatus Obscuribacter sp.]
MTNSNNDDVRLLKSNKDIWSEARIILEKKLSQPSFESWIRPAQLIEFSQGQATIAVSNEFMRGMFTNNYVDSVCDAISQVTGENVSIRVVVDASVKSETYTATIASISDEPNNTAQHDSQANHYLGNSNSGHGHNGHHLLGNQSSPPWATNNQQPV